MKIRVDYMDGWYRLGAVNGTLVDLPRWVVWVWRFATWLKVWIDRHYVVPADNAAHEEDA